MVLLMVPVDFIFFRIAFRVGASILEIWPEALNNLEGFFFRLAGEGSFTYCVKFLVTGHHNHQFGSTVSECASEQNQAATR